MSYEASLGALGEAVAARVSAWEDEDVFQRLQARDHTLWTAEPQPEIADRLGWLTLHQSMRPHLAEIEEFVAGVEADGITDIVLLGMGGSSLAPEVFMTTFGSEPGYPALRVLDSTHPAAVTAVTQAIDPATTLFLVSSKSGTTVEPLSLLAHFWDVVSAVTKDPGRHFAAITDPGSQLGRRARSNSFRAVFETISDVGGRYSALTHFGLVPAALIGVDVSDLLDRVAAMAASPADSIHMGAVLGEAALAGSDKATWMVSETFGAFPGWVEQLVAESTGKSGSGILPVAGETAGQAKVYGNDRLFIYLALRNDEDVAQRAAVELLEFAGFPVVRIVLDDPADLAAEMYRAEVAVALAGSVLGIHPFNQPDVQMAKKLAQEAIDGTLDAVEIPEIWAEKEGFAAEIRHFLDDAEPGSFVALQAFIEPTREAEVALQDIRHSIRGRLGVATTVGFGPRFLHSTGQFHKGGTNSGLFLQITDHPGPELPVPGSELTFARLISGQADGDHQALTDADRRVLRVCLGDDVAGGLEALAVALS